MDKTHYPKQLISFEEQIALLKNRGLIFNDEAKALHLLQNISIIALAVIGTHCEQISKRIYSNWELLLKQPLKFTNSTANYES